MKKKFFISLFLSVFIGVAFNGVSAEDSTLIGLTDSLRDVKAPVSLPSNDFLPILLFVFLAGIVLVLIRFFMKKEKKIIEVPQDTRLPWEIACEELKKLEGSSLLAEGQFKTYYSQLSDIVRRYFENQFNIRAPEMTTEEFLWSLDASHNLTNHQKDILQEFLNSCDIVKFAKYIPGIEEGKESFQLAWKLVEETKVTEDERRLDAD